MFKLVRKILGIISFATTLIALAPLINPQNKLDFKLDNIIKIEQITPTPSPADSTQITNDSSGTPQSIPLSQILKNLDVCKNEIKLKIKALYPVEFKTKCYKDSTDAVKILSSKINLSKYKAILLIWPNKAQLPISAAILKQNDVLILNEKGELIIALKSEDCKGNCTPYTPFTNYTFLLFLPQHSIKEFKINENSSFSIE